MKKISLVLFMLLSFLQQMDARTVNYPSVQYNSTDQRGDIMFTICGVDILKDSTVVRASVKYRPEYWINISKNTYIKVKDTTYPITGSKGIKIDELFWMPKSGIAEFDLIFPPIPENTKIMDLVESPDWQFLGIDVSDIKDREQNFYWFSQNPLNYQYTYLSPLMIKTLSSSQVQGIPTYKLTRLEMVSTTSQGNDDKLTKAVLDVINRHGLELISKENSNKISEFYAVWDDTRKLFTKLLIIQSSTLQISKKILFLEGAFDIYDIQELIKTPKLGAIMNHSSYTLSCL